MALSKHSVNTAISILKKIARTKQGILTFNDSRENLEGRPLGKDKKSDGGYESVFLNIYNISQDELAYFNERKGEISNTSFVRSIGDNYTRIGWY